MDHQTLNFTLFQLNTLDLSSDSGVKNCVWTDGGNHLFHKILAQPWMPKAIRHERLQDLNPDVFRKLLALYLNGAPEVTRALAEEGGMVRERERQRQVV
jgi:hypothetical protein